jgi:hypothetical protein
MNFKMIKTPVMLVALGSLMVACGTTSSMLGTSGISDRFSQIFGSNSQAAGESANAGNSPDETDLYCPDVIIREGTATLTSTVNGVSGVAATRYQGTITRTARECVLQGGTTLAVKIGIQGRVIAGPAGAPPEVEVPLRVAVVQEGAPPKTIFSRFYKIPVAMTEGNTAFSFVAEDISYPAPSASAHANYVYYVGFDPEGLRQQPARGAKKKGR